MAQGLYELISNINKQIKGICCKIESLANGGGSEPAYKVYTALLTQSGTDAPVPIVLQNTLGETITFFRDNVGQYRAVTTGIFPQDKTWAVINTPSYDGNGPFALQIGRISNTECHIYSYQTYPSSTVLADLGTNADRTSIEIRVYN